MYTLLLKYETEEKQVKELIKWAKNCGYNVEIEQWGIMCFKGFKFTPCYLKENFSKMLYHSTVEIV